MMSRALKMAFWVTFDHVGKLMAVSVLWAIAVGFPGLFAVNAFNSGDRAIMLLAGVPALVVCTCLTIPVMGVGLAHMVKEFLDTRDGSIRTFFSGIRFYWKRAIGLGVSYTLVCACLAVSVVFYSVKLRDTVPWLGFGLAALALWALVLVALSALLALPTLVQKKAGVKETVKLSFLLVLDNPLMSVGLGVQVIAISALFAVITPLMLVLYGGVLAALTGSAYEMLSRKYAYIQATSQDPHERGGVRPLGIGRMKPMTYDEMDAQDDYLNRGFRDLLFPWKG